MPASCSKKEKNMELFVNRTFRHWWAFLLRGILFILVGIYMIASPLTSFVALGFFFGLVIFLAGLAELLHASGNSGGTGTRRGHLAFGIIDIILGIVLMGHVAVGVAILRIIVGIWFILRGISLFNFSRTVGRSWMLKLGGVLTFIFGLLILFNVAFGSFTIILFIAIAFIITGIFNVWLGLTMKRV